MANASIHAADNNEKALNEVTVVLDGLAIEQSTDDKSHTNESELLECPVCLQVCVHPSKLPCGHIFCFLCVKGLKNRRCAMCRAEFSNEFLDRPQLLMPISTTPSTSNLDVNEYQWFYKGHNGWWQYDERTCQEIEDAYKKAQKQCTILVAGNLYIVDFDQMLQKRQTDPSRKRQVKRDLATVPKKGVAGLRLWNPDDTTQNAETGGNDSSNSNSNLVATIAATEAAIRIASDIIDSTLAHADDHGDHRHATVNANFYDISRFISQDTLDSVNNESTVYNQNVVQLSNRSDNSTSRGMLDEIEETFNITNPSSINTSFLSTPTSHFFSSTLDEFRNLTLNNIADDSSDENVEDDDDDDDDDTTHFQENNGHFVEHSSSSRN